MTTRDSTTRQLNFRNALRLKMAEYWLRLGQAEIASRELNRLPDTAVNHPDVQRLRAQISARLVPH